MSKSQPIPDATDREKDTIRSEIDTVFTPSRASDTNGKLHIPNEGEPLCTQRREHTGDAGFVTGKVEYVEKDVAVFPPGYREWCSYCLEVWRDD